MILLFLKTIDENHLDRTFSCQVNQLETALEALSTIAASGETLVEAYLLEEGKRTNLPVEAFDGQPLNRLTQLKNY